MATMTELRDSIRKALEHCDNTESVQFTITFDKETLEAFLEGNLNNFYTKVCNVHYDDNSVSITSTMNKYAIRKKVNEMEPREILDIACNLYGGGWRAGDKDWLMDEYGITDKEAKMLCEALWVIENMQEALT